MNALTKYKGSIKLAAIGDALGWMTEFEKSPEDLKKKYGVDFINQFFNWEKNVGGRFYGYKDDIKAGSYSDDTQLLLAVARSIKEDGTVDQNYFSKIELPNWLLYARGAGRTIKNAARKIERKSAAWNNNFFTFKAGKATIDYRESGANGAAMRVLPIALANFGDIEKIKKEIFSNSIITHGHPRAIAGAMLYGIAVDTILQLSPENFDYINFLTKLGKDIHTNLSIPFIDESELKAWETAWNEKDNRLVFKEVYDDVVSEIQQGLRNAYKFIKEGVSDFEALSNFGCYKYETKGSGVSTVIAGIFLVCKYADDPLKSIEIAVNSIGTDTDSIAAFAGGLVGALSGQKVIPERWKTVQDIKYLDKISERLLEISESRALFNEAHIEKNTISINIINTDNYKQGDKIYFEPLGNGVITKIDKQDAITKGKFNIILSVEFESGQSCVFSKLLSSSENLQEDNKKEWLAENKSKFNVEEYRELKTLKSKRNWEKIIELLLLKIPDRDEQ
jgi:ADP-ribosylglycohydrolase